ncbi:molybdenum cofactor guanylyltransferase [Cohnella xylanilytica]|uniref:Molybdenum cofactor guanylyltransferase n=1 Tax=Cohnella xylanilytica TaxID=557555 RepID=A0A841U1Z1_9BACL|nr:molybdenum cofactor guanylyltransferase [Cohnella xylanilytica]MBB6693198.1 molybdenum cofactor guanylyltransferase [Cohnella xylanilytica]
MAEERERAEMLSGIILAGGAKRSILGDMKSLAPMNGETLIERQVRLLGQICDEIVIVTDSPRSYLRCVSPPVRIVSDYRPGGGPLAGMAAGLSLAQRPYAWIVGCDMPDPSPAAAKAMLRKLVSGVDAVWPSDGNGPHPLHGVYDCRCAPRIAALAESGETSLSTLPACLAWEELTEGECAQLGIGFGFMSRIGSESESESESGSGSGRRRMALTQHSQR